MSTTNAQYRFNNDLRYRDDGHDLQRQLTPAYVLEPVRSALGGVIELDPCTEPNNPCGADRFFTPPTDGAVESWQASTIYVNPPYSKARERWVQRCIEAASTGARVVLLMPSHTDTRLFHRATEMASHVVFIKGRVKFGVLRRNGRQEAASHPSCLICWNLADVDALAHLGRVWTLPTHDEAPPMSAAESAPAVSRPEGGWLDGDVVVTIDPHGVRLLTRIDVGEGSRWAFNGSASPARVTDETIHAWITRGLVVYVHAPREPEPVMEPLPTEAESVIMAVVEGMEGARPLIWVDPMWVGPGISVGSKRIAAWERLRTRAEWEAEQDGDTARGGRP